MIVFVDKSLFKVVGTEHETKEFISKAEKFGASLKIIETEKNYC